MKTKRCLVVLAACGLGLSLEGSSQESAAAGLPEVPGAKVTIPYSELKNLWEKAQDGKRTKEVNRPPVSAVVLEAKYELEMAGSRPLLRASYRVQSYVDRWQRVALLGGPARLQAAESEEGEVIWTESGYCFLFQGAGVREVQVAFVLENDVEQWIIRPGAASLKQLHVAGVAEKKTVRVNGRLAVSEAAEGLTWHLPGAEEDLTILLEQAAEPEEEADPGPPAPSVWDLQSEVFVRFEEGRLHYECQLYCQADNGGGMEMEVNLPQNVLGVSVSGDDFATSKLGRKKEGERSLRIRWKTREVLDRKLRLSYQVPQSPMATEWPLAGPRVPEGGETRTLFALVAVEGLELRGEHLRDAAQSRRLPQWLREQIGVSDFVTAEASSVCNLTTRWLPRLETAQATVEIAKYEVQVVEDGAVLVHANYKIQHGAPLAWRVTLPPYDEILSCSVGKQPAKPVKRGESEIEFALGAAVKGASEVSFCYAARMAAFDPVSGRAEISLPMTDLFIHELKWLMTLPTGLEAEIEGNVGIDRQAKVKGGHVIALKKELVRGEHPAVEIHYRKKGLMH